MSKGCIAIILAALVASCCVFSSHGRSNRALEQARASSSTSTNTNGGSGSSTAVAKSTGGEAIARAGVTTQEVEQVENVVEEVLSKVMSVADSCSQLIQEVSLEVMAEAAGLAKVFTEATGFVSVEGEGRACAEGEGEARAEAVVFAKAIAEAIVTGLQGNAQSNVTAVAEVIAVGFAEAFAEAIAKACTQEGTSEARQTSFASAIIAPVAEAYVLAIAGPTCQTEFQAQAAAEAEITGSSTVDQNVNAGGMSFTAATGESETLAEGDAGADSGQITDEDEIAALTEQICDDIYTICCVLFDQDDECPCTSAPDSPSFAVDGTPCNAKRIVSDSTIVWREGDFACKCS